MDAREAVISILAVTCSNTCNILIIVLVVAAAAAAAAAVVVV